MADNYLFVLGVKISLQRLFGGLLGHEAGHVIAPTIIKQATGLAVGQGLLQPLSPLI